MRHLPALVAGLTLSTSGIAMAALPNAPLVRIAEIEIDPAQVDAYRRILAEEIDTSVRVEPGVLSFTAVAIRGAPKKVRITEVYADRAAFEAHLASPHFLKYKALTTGMVRTLVLHDTDPITVRAKPGFAP